MRILNFELNFFLNKKEIKISNNVNLFFKLFFQKKIESILIHRFKIFSFWIKISYLDLKEAKCFICWIHHQLVEVVQLGCFKKKRKKDNNQEKPTRKTAFKRVQKKRLRRFFSFFFFWKIKIKIEKYLH